MTMKSWLDLGWRLAMVGLLGGGGAIVAFPTLASAQVVADPSVGTIVAPNGTTYQITGGTTVGSRNLFHSFSRFDVPTNGVADFRNAPGIVNIFSRVTGGTASQIDGIVRSAGTANLFLINPNGIIFQQNAQLDVGGSFVATTANAIQFGDRGVFDASASQPSDVLTVDPSAFLFNQVPIGAIINRSIAETGFASPSGSPAAGLRVADGKSLLLVGGDISIDGGKIHALGGWVELGGLAEAGTIGLDIKENVFKLIFPSNRLLSNLSLAKDARVSVRGSGGGYITVNTNIFNATDGGRLTNGTEGEGNAGDTVVNANIFSAVGRGASGNGSGLYNLALGSGNAGNVIVNANSILLDRSTIIRTASLNKGRGGNIFIRSNELIVRNGGQIVAGSGSPDQPESVNSIAGSGGNITINVTNLIELDSSQPEVTDLESLLEQGRSGIFSPTSSFSNAGNITIHAGQLKILNGAIIETGASVAKSLGGNGGNIEVYVSGSIEASGRFSGFTAEANGIGNAGNIVIKTGALSVSNNAVVSSVLTDGARGQAGDVFVEAKDAINISNNGFIASAAGERTIGDAGQISITANSLSLSSGASVASFSSGQGNAGNIKIQVNDQLKLTNSSITASANAGSGGEINITAGKVRLIGDSDISTSVASSINGGGNIRIDADYILALNDSDIFAFSKDGQGGNISLSRAFFGVGFQPSSLKADPQTLQGNDLPDINATGQVSSGTVNTPDNSLIQNSLTQLSQALIDSNTLLANSCIVRRDQQNGNFTVTGSGGLPDRPDNASASPFPTGEVRSVEEDTETSNSIQNSKFKIQNSQPRPWKIGDPIAEPQGVYQLPDGQLVMSRECDQ